MHDDDWKIIVLAVLLSIMWCKSCFCSPPSPWVVEPKIKTEITFEQPLNQAKWTKLHLRATALNYWLPHFQNEFNVSIKGNGIIVKPSGKRWKKPNYGDVFTNEFLVRPYKYGGIILSVNYSICGSNYFVIINPDLTVQNLGSYEEIWKNYVRDTSEAMKSKVETGYAHGVFDSIRSRLPKAVFLPPYIDSDKIILNSVNTIYTIYKPIAIGMKTKLEISMVNNVYESDNYNYYMHKNPVLMIRQNNKQMVHAYNWKDKKQDSLLVFYKKKENQYTAVLEIEPTSPGKINRLLMEEKWIKGKPDFHDFHAYGFQRHLSFDFDSSGTLRRIGIEANNGATLEYFNVSE